MKEKADTAIPAFLAGALIGAGVALLLEPQSGSQLRGMFRGYAAKAPDNLLEQRREVLDTAVEKGKEYVESGKDIVREAANATDEGVWDNAKKL